MNTFNKIASSLRALFRREKLDAEMAEEMRQHLERRAQLLIAEGLSPEEARFAAQRAFGGMEQLKEIAREQRGWVWLDDLIRDTRFAFRQLRKSPGFTFVAVLTLALGIGANTTFFSVLYGVVLRSLPFPNAGELVVVQNLGPTFGNNDGRIALAELRDFRERQHSLVGIGAYSIGRVTLNRGDGAERVIQISVTANLFPLLGIAPALGRGLTEAEERAGQDSAIVISHEFWQAQLGGAGDVLGRTVRLNGAEHIVVGVMPAGFLFAEPGAAIWKPLNLTPRGAADRNDRSFSTLARLLPGTSLAAARADLQRVAQRLQVDLPAAYPAEARWSLDLTPLRQSQFGRMLAPLGMLMAAAAAVLLIAGVNVTIMFLLRAAIRRREILIRVALGATRWHIIRQSLVESAAVCVFGTAAGVMMATLGLEALKAFPPAAIPRLQDVAIDGPVAAFTVGVMLIVTMAVGLAPALASLKTRVNEGGLPSLLSTETRSAVRLRDTLTVVEIALAVMLLVCGGLAVRSLQGLLREDLGFNPTQLFTFKTNLTQRAYPDLAGANRFYEQLATKLESLPGVTSVAAVSHLPLTNESQFSSAAPLVETAKFARGTKALFVAWRVVRGPYFSTLGSTLLRGRFFNDTDVAGAAPVAMVDDEFARRFWADEAEALGQSVRFGNGANAETRTIVGVVHRVKHIGPGKESPAEAYVPQAQFYQRGMYTVLKTTMPPASLAPLVRARLAEIDSTVPMYFSETMEQRHATALALPRFTAGLVSTFSAVALMLAGVGIFGVTAYSVAQRSREFGIRFALGAGRTHVASIVLGRVARLAVLGGAIGAIGAYFLAQLATSLLFGVQPADPATLGLAAVITAVVTVAASLVPLLRALRVNPAEALRAE